MKRILSAILGLFFFIAFSNIAFAAEKVVQLDVPGCRPCGAAKRIDTIIKKVDGVIKHETKEHDLLIITFDDKKTNLKLILDKLKKEHLLVKGKPVILK